MVNSYTSAARAAICLSSNQVILWNELYSKWSASPPRKLSKIFLPRPHSRRTKLSPPSRRLRKWCSIIRYWPLQRDYKTCLVLLSEREREREREREIDNITNLPYPSVWFTLNIRGWDKCHILFLYSYNLKKNTIWHLECNLDTWRLRSNIISYIAIVWKTYPSQNTTQTTRNRPGWSGKTSVAPDVWRLGMWQTGTHQGRQSQTLVPLVASLYK